MKRERRFQIILHQVIAASNLLESGPLPSLYLFPNRVLHGRYSHCGSIHPRVRPLLVIAFHDLHTDLHTVSIICFFGRTASAFTVSLTAVANTIFHCFCILISGYLIVLRIVHLSLLNLSMSIECLFSYSGY